MMGISYSYKHAAVLCAQLPRESRVLRAQIPECSWSDTDYLLQKIEYELRVLLWRQTKDAKHGMRKPKPLPTPADEARLRRKLERTDVADIARKLNLKGV